MAELPKPNPLFHQSVRTRLAVLLNSKERSFSQLKSQLDVTDGNLDAHLRKFSSAGYLHSQMVLSGRPHTVYQLSESGSAAFMHYINDLLRLIDAAKKAN